jgi:hypothetical protein
MQLILRAAQNWPSGNKQAGSKTSTLGAVRTFGDSDPGRTPTGCTKILGPANVLLLPL